jgi:hypothetical protein
LTKTEEGIKIYTDHKEELLADVVLFATGNNNPCLNHAHCEEVPLLSLYRK